MNGRNTRGAARKRVTAAIGHALAFATWTSLADDGALTDVVAADLMCRLAAAAGAVASAARSQGR